MTDKPYPTGQVCIVIYDPTGLRTGTELTIASQRTVVACRDMLADPRVARAAHGLIAQNVEISEALALEMGVNPIYRASGFFPIRWMVPKGVNPDPEVLDVGVDVADDLEVTA